MADATREFRILYGGFAVASITFSGGSNTLAFSGGTYVGWVKVGIQIRITGSTNPANDGTYTVTAVTSSSITVTNASGVTEGATAKVWYEVGGSSSRHHFDKAYLPEKSYQEGVVRFKYLLADTSGSMDDAAFTAEEQAALEIFRTPRLDFVLTLGSSTVVSWKHSDNTAFDAQPSISKPEGPAQTARSMRFDVQIRFRLPADNVNTSGRQDSMVTLSYTPSRRASFTIDGTYTALPSSTTSLAAYQAAIAAYAASVASVLGISTYELVNEAPVQYNDTNKTCTFSRTYREITYPQAGSSNDSALVDQHLKIRRSKVGPGDTPTADRLVTYTADYDVSVDKTVTTDLHAKWETIKEWIITRVQALSGGSLALTSLDPSFDYDENRISASMTFLASEGAGVLEHTETTTWDGEPGTVLVPAWGGDPRMKYAFSGPARKTRTISVRQRVLGSSSGGSRGGFAGGASPLGIPLLVGGAVGFGGGLGQQLVVNPGGGNGGLEFFFGNAQQGGGGGGGGGAGGPAQGAGESAVTIKTRDSRTPLTIGIDGQTIDVTDIETEYTSEYFVPVPLGGGGGGTASNPA